MNYKAILLFLGFFLMSSTSWATRPPPRALDPIHLAAKNGELDEIKEILKKSPELLRAVSPEGWTPFQYAALGGYVNIAEFFILNGIDVNEGEKSVWNIMAYAHGESAKKMVTFLKNNGADLNGKKDNYPALFYAVDRNNIEMVEILLFNGADINAKVGAGGQTVIYTAAKNDYLFKMFEFLISKGANVNVPDVVLGSPLSEAVKWGQIANVKLLLQYGADKNIKNSEGKIAIDLANEALGKILKNGEGLPISIKQANEYREIISLLNNN